MCSPRSPPKKSRRGDRCYKVTALPPAKILRVIGEIRGLKKFWGPERKGRFLVRVVEQEFSEARGRTEKILGFGG